MIQGYPCKSYFQNKALFWCFLNYRDCRLPAIPVICTCNLQGRFFNTGIPCVKTGKKLTVYGPAKSLGCLKIIWLIYFCFNLGFTELSELLIKKCGETQIKTKISVFSRITLKSGNGPWPFVTQSNNSYLGHPKESFLPQWVWKMDIFL